MTEPIVRTKKPRRPRRKAPEASQQPVRTAEDLAWDKACNEVCAAFLAQQVRETGNQLMHPPALLASIRMAVPMARASLAPTDHEPGCRCRHYAIIESGAVQTVTAMHRHATTSYMAAMAALDRYLDARS
jgi:hypothetical protein